MQIVEPLLGTRAEVHAAASTAAAAQAVENGVLEAVSRLEQLFTVFEPSSALNEFRRTGSTTVPELVEVIELAQTWHQRSDAIFDPNVQPLMELWDRAEIADRLPTPAELQEAQDARAAMHIAADNLNAIAKGWIAQTAVCGVGGVGVEVDSVWLSLGGDIVHRGSDTMTVGIENPLRPYDNIAPLAAIEIANEAIATSGGARRSWTIQGQRYAKVLDARSGWPVERVASATIVADDAAVADVLATIATIASTDETLALVSEADAACLLIHSDGSRTCSSERFRFL